MTAQSNNGRLISQDTEDKDAETSIAQSCKGCIFAEINYNGDQYGCLSGRLRKYHNTTELTWVKKKYEFVGHLSVLFPQFFPNELTIKETNQFVLAEYHNDELVGINNEFVDEVNERDEGTHVVINDRYCNLYRNKKSPWAENLNQEKALSKARAEIALKVSALIYFDSTHTVEMLRTSIQSCLDQQLKPVQIVVLNNQNDIAVSEVLKQMLVEYPGITWTNSRSLWGDGDIGLCVDDVLSQDLIVGAHFLLINSGTILNPELISDLDVSLNDKLERWMCLTGGDILVVQTKLARVLDGFQEVKPTEHDKFIYGLENKIKWFAEKTGKPHFVKELADVVQ